jgi:hypothetical protein
MSTYDFTGIKPGDKVILDRGMRRREVTWPTGSNTSQRNWRKWRNEPSADTAPGN